MHPDDGKGQTEEVVGLLRELIRWTRAMASPLVRERLECTLRTAEERRIYGLTDGLNSTRQIAKAGGVSKTTVGEWHRKWEQEGIVTEVPGSRGKRCKLFSLSEVGMSIAPLETGPDDTPVDEENA